MNRSLSFLRRHETPGGEKDTKLLGRGSLLDKLWGVINKTQKNVFEHILKKPNENTKCLPWSSSFLLRQTREKPLWATVCFSIEHARVRHAHVMHLMPSSFVNNFSAGSFAVQKNQNVSHQKRWQKNDLILTVFLLFASYHSTKMTPLF